MTAIIFIIVLAILIFVHELGHFLLARANGIRVDEFKLGFGPKIFKWKRGETEYGVNIIPFGGFVKIFGENPDEESISGPGSERSMVRKSRLQQVSVLAAGVLFNFIFAWMLYTYVFVSGVTATTDGFGSYASRFTNPRIMVTLVEPKSPAEKAGLAVGDVVTSVVSSKGTITSKGDDASIVAIQNAINESGGSALTINVIRSGATSSLTAVPVSGLVKDKYAVGIGMSTVANLKLPFFISIWEGLHYTWSTMKETAIGLYTFVVGVFVGTADFSQISGPVGIAGIVGDAAAMGFTYLIMITALISVNLGVINLVPFPALDGGRILFVAIEGIIHRRISPKFSNVVNMVGFVILMILMVLVTYKDILKLVRH